MKKKMFLLCAVILLICSTSLYAGTAVLVQYGTVTEVGVIQKDAQHAGGALAGGLVGALAGPTGTEGSKF